MAVSGILVLGLSAYSMRNDKLFQIARNIDIFATLFKELNTYYVDPIDPTNLVETGIKSMLESLDPYTDFIPEAGLDDYRMMTTGQYGGIGALVGKKDGNSVIIMPYEGFPAYQSGLQIGDIVTKIDGVDISKMNNGETSKLLKGTAKTPVVLTIKRYGRNDEFDVKIIREKITIKNVPFAGMVSDEIGLIKLADFTTDAGLEVRKAVKQLKLNGAKNIILDLRGNPGGLLDEAVNVANIFVPKGSKIVSTKGKIENWNQAFHAKGDPEDLQIPLVVLTDRGSASASEIVSGVMQDYDRAVLIGRRTFGKGLVQSTRPLAFNTQLKLTTAKYYIPSGRCIQAIDYSHREEDGSVSSIPDSLKLPFKTAKGRITFDGGGIEPDIVVDQFRYSSFSYHLVNSNLIFDFATMYRSKNESIGSPEKFQLSDEDYQSFTKWVLQKDLRYTTRVETQLEELTANAKDEKYYQVIKSHIEKVESQLQTQKSNDLVKFKPEIKRLIEQEIVTRYYLQSGAYANSFIDDPDVNEAIKVLRDKRKYDQILSAKG